MVSCGGLAQWLGWSGAVVSCGGVAQWLAYLSRNRSMCARRNLEYHQKLALFPCSRNLPSLLSTGCFKEQTQA